MVRSAGPCVGSAVVCSHVIHQLALAPVVVSHSVLPSAIPSAVAVSPVPFHPDPGSSDRFSPSRGRPGLEVAGRATVWCGAVLSVTERLLHIGIVLTGATKRHEVSVPVIR